MNLKLSILALLIFVGPVLAINKETDTVSENKPGAFKRFLTTSLKIAGIGAGCVLCVLGFLGYQCGRFVYASSKIDEIVNRYYQLYDHCYVDRSDDMRNYKEELIQMKSDLNHYSSMLESELDNKCLLRVLSHYFNGLRAERDRFKSGVEELNSALTQTILLAQGSAVVGSVKDFFRNF